MSDPRKILTFEVCGERYGIRAGQVREVLRAVSVTRLPGAPDVVEGVIDLRGVVVPVIDLRTRLGLPPKPVEVSDHLIVAVAGDRVVALRVDEAKSLTELDVDTLEAAERLAPAAEFILGLARLPEGLVVIHDLERFLSGAEAEVLAEALGNAAMNAGAR